MGLLFKMNLKTCRRKKKLQQIDIKLNDSLAEEFHIVVMEYHNNIGNTIKQGKNCC